jgi:hypothetical protein
MACRTLSMNEAARLRRARRAVKRQGLLLCKGHPSGEWYLMEPSHNVPVHTLPDLDAVEAWLSTKK